MQRKHSIAFITSISAALLTMVGATAFAAPLFSSAVQGPVHVFERTWKTPNGVVRVETETWGSPNVHVVRMTPQQAAAFWRQQMAPFAAMQEQMVAMQRQLWNAQRLLSASFLNAPIFGSPLSVEWADPLMQYQRIPGYTVRYWIVSPGVGEMPMERAQQSVRGPHSAPAIPASSLPNSGTYQVSWKGKPATNPKIPL